MLKARPYTSRPLLLLVCSLALAGTAFCSAPASEQAPNKPGLTPTGPMLVLDAGKAQTLHAFSPGATRFEWALAGEGKLSSGDGDTVLYSAPNHGGAVALVTVIAHNHEGASPQSSITISTAVPPVLSLDAVGIPAGWKAGREDPTRVIHLNSGGEGCHTGADCIEIHYQAGATWAGIVWWPKDCSESGPKEEWGMARSCSCATNVLKAGNLREVSRVSFWAHGERGGEVIEFKVGDDNVCPVPGRSCGLLTLTEDWRRYEIFLEGLDMRRAVALFSWVATDLHNPKGVTFYLDDVQFEGTR